MLLRQDQVAGVVLCGGESKRMGRSKAELPFGETTLLRRAVDRLRGVVSPIVIVAAADQTLPTDTPDDALIARDANPQRGPLEGLRAGLAALSDESKAAYVTSCDAPFLNIQVVSRLIEMLGDHDIAAPFDEGRPQPLAAVYRTNLLPRIDELLAQDQLRPFFLIDSSDTLRIDVADLRDIDPELRSFMNCNRPEDYEAALRLAGLSAPQS